VGMTSTEANVYKPGVCNIGPAEIRQRQRVGYIGLAVTVVFLVVTFAFGWATPWRLFAFVPAVASASGFLQAQLHFCARFGAKGLFNFGQLGAEENVMEAEFHRKDQRKAALILVLSVAIGIVIALLAWLIP
jgi:Na+/proline symporter